MVMAEPNPTSPPLTRGPSNDFDTGFEQLMQHNAVTPYQRSPYHVEDTTYPQSAPSTMYNSPASRPVLLDPYDQRYFNGGTQPYMDTSNFGAYGVGIESAVLKLTLLISKPVKQPFYDVPPSVQRLSRHEPGSQQC